MNTASAQASLSASNAAKALKTTRSMAVDSTHFSLTSGSTIGQEFYSVPVDDGSGTLCFPLGSQAYLSTLGLLPLAADRKSRFYIDCKTDGSDIAGRSAEHTFELQSLILSSYAVFCLNTKTNNT